MVTTATPSTDLQKPVSRDQVASTSERMQCMEVWGGNQQADRHVEMTGLEAWIFSQPHQQDQAGGDVYYVSSCASGRVSRLLLADVSGHGQDASKSALGLRELMRRNVNIIQPTRFVRAMNRQFAAQEKDHRFATALLCSYFSPTSRMTLCNAGHPEPLYRNDQGRWVRLSERARSKETRNFPLGLMDDADYSEASLTLRPGQMLLLYSDAFIESCDAAGELLGTEGLLQIVRQLDAAQPAQLIPQLIAKLQQINPSNLSDDDATVLLIRSTGTKPSLKDSLLAPLRLLRRVQDRTQVTARE